MQYILVILLSYILGSSNMAKYIAAVKKVDLSAGGSGNPGASNAVILMGWGASALTAVHDIGNPPWRWFWPGWSSRTCP